MKKISLLLLFGILTLSLFAQNGVLTITSASPNQRFWLFIDDVLQNQYSTNSIQIQQLELKQYKVRVEMDNPAGNCVGQKLLIAFAPNSNVYLVNSDRSGKMSLEKSRATVYPVFVQSLIMPDYSYYSEYQQFLYPGFDSRAVYGKDNQSRGASYQGYQHSRQGNARIVTPPTPPVAPPPPMPTQRGYGNTPPAEYGHSPCIPQVDFTRMLSTIQKETFENTKLTVAKQITSYNMLCATQIAQICNLFTYENSKLEYAKYAYSYCSDKNNYYLINDVFSYSSSKEELNKFISRR
ncbi:MAG: DUF4476 domain-containing protein [Bacteroidales bacterium]|nr:DUF4476 domain-containing protein [Bacteroidales bacterium]MCL2133194.1 DUF4476 domain-containing protein [Bacteroidales bacterium]